MSDWDAATYDRVSEPQVRWARDVIERIEGSPARILDAGCGSGRVTQLLLERFPSAHVIAVDASETMVEQARARLGDSVEILHGDLTSTLDIEPVDVVFSNAVFHWVADHERLFANLASVLRPGGQLVAQWGGAGNIARFLEATADLPDPAPPNFQTAEATEQRLIDAGFHDVRTWLHADPADFDAREDFEIYLRTVCLRCHLDLAPEGEHDDIVTRVAGRLPDLRIDYVRLNATARR